MDSDPTSPPKNTGEEEARASSSSSPRKRRQRTSRHPSHSRRPHCQSLCSLLRPLPPPSYLPPDLDPSFPLLSFRGEEEARASPPPPPRKRRRRNARRSSPLRHRRCRSPHSPCSPPPSSPTPSATHTHPLRPDVCIVALTNWLIVVFFYFIHTPCALRVASAIMLRRLRTSSSKRLIVISYT